MNRSDYRLDHGRFCDAGVLLGLDLRSALRERTDRQGDGEAVVDGPLRLSWRTLRGRAEALADDLADRGIGAGDVVGLHLANSAAFVVAHAALGELGAVTLPLHVPYREHELADLLARTGAVACIVATGDAVRRIPLLPVRIVADLDSATFALDGRAAGPRGLARRIDPDEPFVLCPTSGTESAQPKLCVHTHDGLLSNAATFRDESGTGAADRILVGGGYTHLFGLLGVHLAFVSGATLLALRRFDARAFLRLARAEHATQAWAPPAQLHDALDAVAAGEPAPALREVRSAGAAVGADLVDRVRTSFGADVVVHWGMSELGGGITRRYADRDIVRDNDIGHPIAGATVRIARDDDTDAAPNEVGHLLYRRADMFRGYYGDDASTATSVVDGWLRTGDLAARDEHGAIRFCGRAKDIINRGGYKISALEVESHLANLAGVRRCALVAVPDDRLGERAVLALETSPGVVVTLDDVRAHLDALHVAKYKWPEAVVVFDSLPLTPTGKVAKAALRALVRERATVPA